MKREKQIAILILILNLFFVILLHSEEKKIPGPKDGKLIKGVVINKTTKKPSEGEVLAIPADDEDGKIYTYATGKDGKFAFRVPKDKNYIIKVNVPNCEVFIKKLKKKENWKAKTVLVKPKPKPVKVEPDKKNFEELSKIIISRSAEITKKIARDTVTMLNVFRNMKLEKEAKKPVLPKPKPAITKEEQDFINNVKLRFKFKTLIISKKYYSILQKIADILKKYPDIKIEIQGHTDMMHEVYRKLNYRIAYNRALIVSKYFVFQGGIASSRIIVKSFGPEKPLYPNTTKQNRDKNRRIEFKVIRKTINGKLNS